MKRSIVALCALALGAAGCANMSETQQNTAKGAGIGAAAGALIGLATAGGNKGKSAATGAAAGAAVGALGGYIWSKRMEEQRAKMEQASAGTGIGVERTADNQIRVQIPSDAGFDVGRSAIRPQLASVLDKFAQSMREHPATEIRIIGHTDSTGSDAVNNPLSIERAASTRDYLVARGVAVSRISIDGRGSREPVASNDTAEGRAKNRRVEIFVAEREQTAQAR
ncbi:OmpA family protein [Caldimonas manganoxidans]|jgi:outer membrane protein OmpA-like peptidoglycan-associated protein|uniref:OmpA family protein n=1 Tax=Caldimonas manganoxidans TaxID=196015 RepID=UPI000374CBDC|nr:OmpA family protein [Caldimonas manganoxidans]